MKINTMYLAASYGLAIIAASCIAQAQPVTLKFPDFNGDGKSDIFLYNPSQGWTWCSLSDGSGVFRSFIPGALSPFANLLLVGDFNGDHKTDIWFGGVLDPGLSNGNCSFVFPRPPSGPPFPVPPGPYYDIYSLVADINGDGKSDVGMYQRSFGPIWGGISAGATFSFITSSAYFGPSYDIVRAADFNRDGIPDLLLYDRDTPRTLIGINDGKGNFTISGLSLSPGYDIIETGDLNGDGAADLVLYNSQTGTAQIGLNDGAGGFRFTYHLWRRGISRIRIADVDGDAHLDLLLYSQSIGAADLGYGDGSGGFQFKNLLWGPGYDTVEVADFNGDGKADLLLYNSRTGTAYTAVSDGSPAVFAYHYHLWMPGLIVGTVQDSGQILPGPPILFSFQGGPGAPAGKPDFIVEIVDPQQVAAARQLVANPNAIAMCGQVVLYQASYNPNWSWHYRPESVSFAEGTIEAIDGTLVSPEIDPTYWANSSFLCVPTGPNVTVREIGPLRP